MKNSRVSASIKEVRGGKTQQELSMELNVSRESVSKIENGRSKVAPDISRKLMEMGDNARLAFALRHEYTGTGPLWLDGPNVDLHRSSVKEKTIEESEEFLIALKELSFSKPLKNLSHWEMPQLLKVLEEGAEAITAIEHLLVVICEEANISYTGIWHDHYIQLKAKEFIQ